MSFKKEAKDKLEIYDFLPVTSSPQEISMPFSAFCHEALQLTISFCVPIRGLQRGGKVFKVSLATLGELPQAVCGEKRAVNREKFRFELELKGH